MLLSAAVPFSYTSGKKRLTAGAPCVSRVHKINQEQSMKSTNPTSQPGQVGGDTARPQADSKPPTTPNADMQAEDTGSAQSESDSATEASRAMKQTGKTAAENKR